MTQNSVTSKVQISETTIDKQIPAFEYNMAWAVFALPIELPIKILVDSEIPLGIIKRRLVKFEIPIEALNSTRLSHPEKILIIS